MSSHKFLSYLWFVKIISIINNWSKLLKEKVGLHKTLGQNYQEEKLHNTKMRDIIIIDWLKLPKLNKSTNPTKS